MKTGGFFSAILFSLLCVGALSVEGAEAGKRKPIYDTAANGNEQIKAALAKAQQENKNVMLKFGANWCGWCHLLSELFHDNPEIAKLLNENYVLVLIDVDKGHNADVVQRYDNPTQHGLPVLVVLDKNGKKLHTQDTGQLEKGKEHDPEKVKEFLSKWKPVREQARAGVK